ncbi:MAG: hypothetical protein JO053_08715 [Acidobacteria bacterium]|nr:hypothetical protein [Acidobacteriota bacterium]
MKEFISTLLLVCTFAAFTPLIANDIVANPPRAAGHASDPGDLGLCPRGTVRRRNYTSHRTKVKHALMSGAAGLVGGALLGGRKGAVIGAGAGAGGYLLYRYVKDRHGKCVLRRA